MLLRMGVRDALVQLGGETSCRGRSPRGAPWRIGVQHPVAADAVWTVITAPATGLSCSTSGDYRRDGRIGDQPVSHLIDPRSGLPACDDLLGATVAIREPGRVADAEALTKAAVFLPPAASIGAAASVSAELLVLRADEAGIEQIASPGWSRLAAP
jgi:thiamine biosynthesis lipoprotein